MRLRVFCICFSLTAHGLFLLDSSFSNRNPHDAALQPVRVRIIVKETVEPRMGAPKPQDPGTGPFFNLKEEGVKAANKEAGLSSLQKPEFVYANYYDRIRKSIDGPWKVATKTFLKKNKQAQKTGMDLRVLVIIDAEGSVVSVSVIEPSAYASSGYDDLVLEMLKGQRWPNVPKGLIDEDGYGRIIWNFIVY